MWCRSVRNLLSAYADGELRFTETRAVEEHLVRCERCSRELAKLRQLSRLTGLVPEEDLPAGLHARILAGLSAAPAAPPRVPVRRSRLALSGPLLCAGLTGAAALLAFGFARTLPGSEQTTRQRQEAQVNVKSLDRAPRPAAPSQKRLARTIPVAGRQARPVEKRADTYHRVVPARPVEEAVNVLSAPAEPAEVSIAPVPESRPAARKALPSRRTRSRPEPREEHPQPPSVLPVPSKPLADTLGPDLPRTLTMSQGGAAAMPGAPAGSSGSSMPPSGGDMMGTDKNGDAARMTGMAMGVEPPAEDDEGVRMLRMFLEERNRTVPQPPASPARDRRGHKSL